MRFSLLLASRGRLDLLKNMLDSICKQTKRHDLVEVLIAIDSDDPTYNIKQLETDYCSINLKLFVRERSEWMHRDYINWLYPNCSGKYIIVLNDDTIFSKDSWDLKGWDSLEQYVSGKPDGVVYGFTETGTGSTLCTFPLFSRNAIDALGWVLPNERKNWGADHDVYAIYSHPLVNRMLYLPEISIHHISVHTGRRGRDEISYSIERSFMSQHNVYIPVSHYVEKLSKYIKSCSPETTTWSGLDFSCILISNGNPDKAVESLMSQSISNWELIIINASNYNNKDSRIKHAEMSGSTGWCINECFRTGLIGGHLVVCMKDGDGFYDNAFKTFMNFFIGNPHEHLVRCAADVINEGIHCGFRRAIPRCDVSLMQICHRRDITNLLCPSRTLWPETGRDLLGHMGQTTKINLLDIKVGRTADEF